VVPGTVTTHEVPLAAALHIRERSEGRVVGEPEELMEESNIVLLRHILRGAWRIAADCRPRAAHLAPHRRGRGERGARVLAALCVVALRHMAGERGKHGNPQTYVVVKKVSQSAGSKASLALVGRMVPSHERGFVRSSRSNAGWHVHSLCLHWCLLSVRLSRRGLINHGHRLGVMKHVHVTHTVRRRMLERPRMQQPVFYDALSDLTL
jgi:hypothetical protein